VKNPATHPYIPVYLAVLALGAGCRTTAVETAQSAWFELRTPRFQVFTHGDPEQARRLVIDLERFHQVMLAKTSAEERSEAPPLRVFLAKDSGSLRAWIGGSATQLGQFRATYRGNYAFVHAGNAGGNDPFAYSAVAILLHEYAHYMMATQGARVPSWYNEGFAEYMAQTQFDDEGAYTVGCPPRYRTRWIEHLEWLPIARVMEADDIAPLVRRASDSYAQAWYAVHYFTADAERNKQIREYLRLWGEGVPGAEAVKAAFGMDYAQLDQVLRTYASRPSFECAKVTPAQALTVPDVQVRPLSEAEAHYRIGDLLLETAGPSEAVFSILNKAASLEGGDPRTLVALARAQWLLAEREDKGRDAALKEARSLLERADKLAADDAERLAVLGHLELFEARMLAEGEQPGVEEAIARARGAYRQAIRKDELLAEAYFGLGLSYVLADTGSEEAVVVLETAAYMLPLDTNIPLAYARIQFARGRQIQSVLAAEYVLRWSKSEEQREAARGLLAQIRELATTPAGESVE
jgi:hypothetical protein